MKLKHNDIEILKDNPFKNCKLERERYAHVLTSIIGNFAEGFVMAINNEWGTGKTTFIKMWKQSLENDGFKTLYFNAWENDYEIEPMIALLGELKTLLGKDNETFKSLLKKGTVFTKHLLPTVAKAFAEKHIPGITEVVEKTVSAATEIFQNEVNNYTEKKKGLIDFKKQLTKLIDETKHKKPIIFFIDELDRCKPDYAVEVLEKVKHFFSVNGIVFVLSIDKKQLECAIQGYYGSITINASEYLRRFIDIEYQLPNPDCKKTCIYYYNYYQFIDFFNDKKRIEFSAFKNDEELFIEFSTRLFENKNITLRQQEKIFAFARMVLTTITTTIHVFPALFFFLIYLRDLYFDIYDNIRFKRYTIQKLVDDIEQLLFPKEVISHAVVYTEAELIVFYHKYLYGNDQTMSPLLIDGNNVREISFKSIITSSRRYDLGQNIGHIYSERKYIDLDLYYLISKIDLLGLLYT